MNEQKLQAYAQLIVRAGANVQPGQRVRLQAEVDQAPLVAAITEACYRAGAAYVERIWSCSDTTLLDYQYASVDTLGEVPQWEEARARQMTVDYPVRIFVESEDPDALAAVPADRLAAVSQMRARVLKKYRDALDGKHQWLIVAAASPQWAKKVFPADDTATAVEKLWQAIFDCVYLSGDAADAEAAWAAHTARMAAKADWLNAQHFEKLHYASANGTDFTVSLIPQAKWTGARDRNHRNGAAFVPNMPTEEVFTSPMRGQCEGRLVATKPLSWSGQLIDGFSVDFRDGRVAECHAAHGADTLRKLFAMDDGASMLGEVALVPKESPINRSGVLFYNTLFDENACCHVAVGRGFPEVIDGFLDMTEAQLHELGLNDSIEHVDFMIGSDDLAITGIRSDGTEVPVFVNGTWAE